MEKVKIDIIVSLMDTMMKKAGITNACLMSSVLISSKLRSEGIPNQVIAGYLSFGDTFAMRHVWVHLISPSHSQIKEFTVDVAKLGRMAMLNPTYHVLKPENCDFVGDDDDMKDQTNELEEMLYKVCKYIGQTRAVVDYETVVSAVSTLQPAWLPIMDVFL